MGGYGSGLYGDGKGKTPVERCLSIDIRQLQKENVLNLKGKLLMCDWTKSGEKVASIGMIPKESHLLLTYLMNKERITTPIYYEESETGYGERKWFTCPYCSKKCALLYLKGKYFACRKCHGLNYKSSQLSGDIDYYHDQLMKICKILNGEYNPMTVFPPYKPKGMHHKTYAKYYAKYIQLAEKRDQMFIAGAQAILDRSPKTL